jgi:Concanavalin A-like lectin/glucanases superfamily
MRAVSLALLAVFGSGCGMILGIDDGLPLVEGGAGGVDAASGIDGAEGGSAEGGSPEGGGSAEGGSVEGGGDGSEAGSSQDAMVDASDGGVCVTDLSGVGYNDFHISFTIVTSESGLTLDLVNQRIGCDESSTFWDVLLNTTGGLELATGDGNQNDYRFVEAGKTVSDGQPHHVVVQRVNGSLSCWIDGVIESVEEADPYDLGTFPPLVLGSDSCPGTTPLAGNGTLTQLCITTP